MHQPWPAASLRSRSHGEVRGDLVVTPGEVLTLWAGGAGQPGGGEGYGDPTHDDFEGGSGGSGWGAGDGTGGGGGAASYLKASGKVVMVAGGGGGSGGYLAGTSTSGGNGSSGGYYPATDPAYPATYGTADDGSSASSKEGGAGGSANGTALEIRRQDGDRYGVGLSLNSLGLLQLRRHHLADAYALFQEAMDIYAELDDEHWVPIIQVSLAETLIGMNRYEEAEALALAVLATFRERGDTNDTGEVLRLLCMARCGLGDFDRAIEAGHEAVELAVAQYDPVREAFWLLWL
jgi:hypothetical protein